ncbi:hypothetical protein BURPS305_3279 [Burkholderia pseudomallei 305]|nr:hypothetical protein BURPS305_3279 [Burkholderia pseudomallei 305]
MTGMSVTFMAREAAKTPDCTGRAKRSPRAPVQCRLFRS